jgi:hypothetical protein
VSQPNLFLPLQGDIFGVKKRSSCLTYFLCVIEEMLDKVPQFSTPRHGFKRVVPFVKQLLRPHKQNAEII